MDIRELFTPVFDHIGNLLISGSKEVEPEHKMLSKLVFEWLATYKEILESPLFTLAPFLAENTILKGKFSKLTSIFKKQLAIMEQYLRKQELKKVKTSCVLDKILQHNQECRDKGDSQNILDLAQIVGNYNLFFFAGTDTSQGLTTTSICMMAKDKGRAKVLEDVWHEISDKDGLTTKEKLEGSQKLDFWVKEALRMNAPLKQTLLRRAQKDVTVGSIHIQKDDYVILLIDYLNKDPEYFENSHEFDNNRFANTQESHGSKLSRFQYIPFSAGKRQCLGRYLGELMVKLTLSTFCSHYEVEKPADLDYYEICFVTNKVEIPEVMLKVK